jgi:hypothetical protein
MGVPVRSTMADRMIRCTPITRSNSGPRGGDHPLFWYPPLPPLKACFALAGRQTPPPFWITHAARRGQSIPVTNGSPVTSLVIRHLVRLWVPSNHPFSSTRSTVIPDACNSGRFIPFSLIRDRMRDSIEAGKEPGEIQGLKAIGDE